MNKLKIIISGIILIVLSSCASSYSEIAYQNALKAKENTLELVDLGTKPYDNYKAKRDSLKMNLQMYYDLESIRKNNKPTIEMWKRLKSEKGQIYLYFKIWKAKGTLSEYFTGEKRKQIESLFNSLIELELAKK